MYMMQDRRSFLATLSSAAAAGLIGPSNSVAQEPPPETTAIRLARSRSICIAPQYVIGDLLQAEGFTDIRYVMSDAGMAQSKLLGRGEIDLTLHFSPLLLIPIDAG
ncbi:MAG: twin-arginine translocation signal domain-containing protein, partial [Xanthobacteraceae bacterium]